MQGEPAGVLEWNPSLINRINSIAKRNLDYAEMKYYRLCKSPSSLLSYKPESIKLPACSHEIAGSGWALGTRRSESKECT